MDFCNFRGRRSGGGVYAVLGVCCPVVRSSRIIEQPDATITSVNAVPPGLFTGMMKGCGTRKFSPPQRLCPPPFRLLKRINSTHLDRLCLGIEGAEDSYFLPGIGFDEFRFIQTVDFVLAL